jgi:hypothetical protein
VRWRTDRVCLQWGFLEELSSNNANTVIGLVRDKSATDKRVSQELGGRSNITILEADLTNHDSIKVSFYRSRAREGEE